MNMTVLPMLAVGFFMNFLAVLFVLVAIVLILVILIQKGRGGGLSGAFGGGMAGSLLGSKTGDFLTWVTIVLVAVFLLLAVVLARFYRPPAGSQYGGDDIEARQAAGTSSVPAEEASVPVTPSVDGGAEPVESAPVAVPEVPEPAPTSAADTNATGG
jgi:preprotein translocase subunit SecG